MADRVGWRGTIVLIAVAGFLVRLLLVAHTRGGDDLRIYMYFARLGLHGHNPFAPPAGGAIPPSDSDNPPLEIAVFTGLLGLHDSATTLRVLFALADAAVILVVGLCFARPRSWRAGFALFYAFNPFVLGCWTGFAEDKTIVFLGIVIWLVALERGREVLSWSAAIFVAIFKFVSVFALPVLGLDALRRTRWKALVPVGAFCICVAASYLVWFPKSADLFTRRAAYLNQNPPIHASPTMLLSRLGIYVPLEAKLFTIVALLAVIGWFVSRRIGLEEAVVWSLLAGTVFVPNNSFTRILLITLPFLFIIEMSRMRWLALWIVTTVSAVAVLIATQGVPHTLAAIGGPLRAIFPREATVGHMFWVNLPLVLMVAFYWADRSRHAPARLDGVRTPMTHAE